MTANPPTSPPGHGRCPLGGHRPWCDQTCDGVVTGVHVSRDVPVSTGRPELTLVRVRREELADLHPIQLLSIQFLQDGEPLTYLLPVRQDLALHRALSTALDLPPTSADN